MGDQPIEQWCSEALWRALINCKLPQIPGLTRLKRLVTAHMERYANFPDLVFTYEICWYFTGSWEQFRIQGKLDIIGEKDMDPVSCLLREKVWFASSLRSRLQYLGPHPHIALSNTEDVENSLDPCTGPVGTFCLLTLDPDQVDYLNLKSNQRIVFKRLGGDVDGNCQWMQQEVNP